ncbi:MAG: InlB B-repeat-containing protein, partial [Fibrobacter sp.]|nr:InlB B-repeat-containing protein [Fibrobacter sp.]
MMRNVSGDRINSIIDFFIGAFTLAIISCSKSVYTPVTPPPPTIYTVLYDLTGGIWVKDTVLTTYTITDDVVLPVADDLVRIGYTFEGWYDSVSQD